MPKMPYGTLLPCTYYANTPLKKALEVSAMAVYVELPASLNKPFKLREKLLDRVQIR
jgi:hypothetical protein